MSKQNAGVKPLDRNAFLKRKVVREVELEDGAVVCIRALPASMMVDTTEETFKPANLLLHSLCDANGELLFKDGEQTEVMSVDHAALKTIMDDILKLNGLKAAAQGEESAAEKN